MSDVVKWGLLAAGLATLIALIMELPFVEFADAGNFAVAIGNIVTVVGGFFQQARGLINCFLLPFGRTALTGLLAWLFGKWAITVAIKIVAWVYHFIFRG